VESKSPQQCSAVLLLCMLVIACADRVPETRNTGAADGAGADAAPPPPAAAPTAENRTTDAAAATTHSAPGIDVELREWRVRASLDSLVTGDHAFVIDNRGERPHTIEIRGDNGARWRTIPIAPGASVTLRMSLPPGRYEIASTDSAYAQRGMRARFVVVVP